jgi:eukaryotic-like serine/threonine-protein kinase
MSDCVQALEGCPIIRASSMSIAAGTRLGPYEIITLVGAGGMGEVYKARDTRLNRIVAIKVLPARYRDDVDRRRRLEREARAIAALAHSHICTLHDVGVYQDGDFLVMEYLEGQTLANRLLRGPLPVDQLLRCGTEIADALDGAHRQGITHRDLKPGNIMLTRSGVKLLDFGLAQLRPAEGAGSETATAVESIAAREAISGTLPYMAPEQLEGATGDARTDIFALGAVLYEMASGRRAFRGDSPSNLIAAILHQHPEPLTSVVPIVSGGLDRLIGKCLAKDPEMRWQSASDLADELRWIAGGGGTDTTVREPSRLRLGTQWAAIVIAVMLTAAGVALWRSRGQVRPGPTDVRYQQVTSTGDVVMSVLSPDGRTVAYVAGPPGGDNRVVVRDLDGGESPIWAGKDILALAWLPDGAHVRRGELRKARRVGRANPRRPGPAPGRIRRICRSVTRRCGTRADLRPGGLSRPLAHRRRDPRRDHDRLSPDSGD